MATTTNRGAIVGDFDPKVFYMFYNAVRPGMALAAGLMQDSGGAINMSTAETNSTSAYSSSENWQLYYQAGRYFIRNYDYGDFQLGLTESERTVPRLMKRSGALGQQWSLIRVDVSGGGWKLSNGLLGNGSWMGVSGKNAVPAMQPSENGAVWDLQTNPSAGSPAGALYQDVDGFEVATTSSRTTSTSMPSSSASQSVSDALRPTSEAHTGSHSTLSTGAIVGIAVGWFLVARRKRKEELPELPVDVKQVYAHRVEMGGEPVVHIAQEKNYAEPRFEVE
ncbi:hypothetical protein DM02DRAFT_683489 [Periconia macrospinosa]|uniref:Uncharacterized protein n=1 Tax=Periconia macrospinosa TaxID=97972 RepID=A0A2V1DIL6_9PLEO|nr:hypothetical protein DM02DRAFT_683489 [Periconia macrospinosa]